MIIEAREYIKSYEEEKDKTIKVIREIANNTINEIKDDQGATEMDKVYIIGLEAMDIEWYAGELYEVSKRYLDTGEITNSMRGEIKAVVSRLSENNQEG